MDVSILENGDNISETGSLMIWELWLCTLTNCSDNHDGSVPSNVVVVIQFSDKTMGMNKKYCHELKKEMDMYI